MSKGFSKMSFLNTYIAWVDKKLLCRLELFNNQNQAIDIK